MSEDAELLRQYARDHSQKAFTELVRRHINFLYSTALRMVGGDAHRARDVIQDVLTDLADKAAALSSRPSVTGWLYKSTRFAAAKAVRADQRRQTCEQKAQIMQVLLHGSDSAANFDQIRPLLDDAMEELSPRDREAVMLRFFEGLTFAHIGASLQLNEDAARMRVDRALERMRARLKQRGITSIPTALAA